MDSSWFLKNAVSLLFIGMFVSIWVGCFYLTHINYESKLKKRRKDK
tara:strand:+ start:515 stop:652 length:138 start_codon:yes stop_codon:yes gene_type:complete